MCLCNYIKFLYIIISLSALKVPSCCSTWNVVVVHDDVVVAVCFAVVGCLVCSLQYLKNKINEECIQSTVFSKAGVFLVLFCKYKYIDVTRKYYTLLEIVKGIVDMSASLGQ